MCYLNQKIKQNNKTEHGRHCQWIQPNQMWPSLNLTFFSEFMSTKHVDFSFVWLMSCCCFLKAPAVEEDLVSLGRQLEPIVHPLFPVLAACCLFSRISFTVFDFCWNGARAIGKMLHILWSVFIWSVKILEKFHSPAAENWMCEPRHQKLKCYCRGFWTLVEIRLSHDVSHIQTPCEQL